MATLENRSRQLVGVDVDGETVYLSPGVTVPVEANDAWKSHLFVKAKWVKYDPLGKIGDDEDEEDQGEEGGVLTVKEVEGEDGVFTVEASDGVIFAPAKNQVREDGTLTAGGLQLHAEAKASQAE